VVHRIITDMAVIDVTESGFVLKEIAPGLTVESVLAATGAELSVDGTLKFIEV
jgi:3-oxoacid CoA-transferase subunit B